MAEGVWYVGGAGANSVAVEFRDFVAIMESPTNEQRSIAVIDEMRRLVPAKPIRYLVNTHHHFDHLGGIRTFVAEGATIITHERIAISTSGSSSPRPTDAPGRPAVDDAKSAGVRDVERTVRTERWHASAGDYAVPGLAHNQNMLIAYLPKEKIVIEGDLYTPPAAGAPAPAVKPATGRSVTPSRG